VNRTPPDAHSRQARLPLTDGEQWAADSLTALRSARFAPPAIVRFLGESFDRAAETRACRPGASPVRRSSGHSPAPARCSCPGSRAPSSRGRGSLSSRSARLVRDRGSDARLAPRHGAGATGRAPCSPPLVGVIVEQAQRHLFQRSLHRRDLSEDVDAVAVLGDHPLQAAHLTLDPAQAPKQLLLARRVAPREIIFA